MSERVIIEHADGRTFSVTPEAAAEFYPDFDVVGAETDASFIATGIPKPKKARRAPAAKNIGIEAPADGSMSAEIEGDPDGEPLPELETA